MEDYKPSLKDLDNTKAYKATVKFIPDNTVSTEEKLLSNGYLKLIKVIINDKIKTFS